MTKHTAPFTLRSFAGAPSQPPSLSTSAVVIIDAQREYDPEGALPLSGLQEALDNIARLQTAARALQVPVIHVAHVGKPGGLFDPAIGGRFIEATGPVNGETVVSKALPNSFAGTTLGETLDALQITNLVLVGFMTHMCVSSTARAALDLGYTTTVVHDATATRSLPSATDGAPVPAETVHQATLAALADRFGIVASTADLLALS